MWRGTDRRLDTANPVYETGGRVYGPPTNQRKQAALTSRIVADAGAPENRTGEPKRPVTAAFHHRRCAGAQLSADWAEPEVRAPVSSERRSAERQSPKSVPNELAVAGQGFEAGKPETVQEVLGGAVEQRGARLVGATHDAG